MRIRQIPRIRGMQYGLKRPESVDVIKADMLSGRFRFLEQDARISGYRDPKGTYHVYDGHHRMAAALEIYREIGEDSFVQMLLALGYWTDREVAPVGSRPMPSRSWWGSFRNWLEL